MDSMAASGVAPGSASSSAALPSKVPGFNSEIAGKFFERVYVSPVVQRDPFAELLRFPADSVAVESMPLPTRTVESEVPAALLDASAGVFVQDCLSAVTRPARVVRFKYRGYGTGKAPRIPPHALSPLELGLVPVDAPPATASASSVSSSSSSPADAGKRKEKEKDPVYSVSAELLEPFDAIKSPQEEMRLRHQNRQPFFSITGLEGVDTVASDLRVAPPLEHERPMLRVSIAFKSVEIGTGELEPVKLSLFIYDVEKCSRLTETFYLDFVSASTAKKVPHWPTGATPLTTAKRVVFAVPNKGGSYYAVMRVEKSFRGVGAESSLEPYFKWDTMKPKQRDKAVAEIDEALGRMGYLMEPMAWTAWPLFDVNGRLTFGASESLQTFARLKAELDENEIAEKAPKFTSEKDVKKLKLVPLTVRLSITEVAPDAAVPGAFNPSLHALQPASKDAPVARELQDFAQRDARAAFSSYTNLMFVYPQNLNFQNVSRSKGNICVSVKFVENDKNVEQPGLPLLFGRSNMPQMLTEMVCAVAYKNKKPVFVDEVKIQLPPMLTESHHVVFTFYEVDTSVAKKKGKDDAQPLLTPLGYAFLPIVLQRRIQKDGVQQLRVAERLPACYLTCAFSDTTDGDIDWVWDGRKVFTVGLRTISTVYSQDGYLNDFLHIYRSHADTQQTTFLKKIAWVRKVPHQEVVRYHVVLLNALMHMMWSYSTDTAVEVMRSMIYVLDCLSQVPIDQSSASVFATLRSHQSASMSAASTQIGAISTFHPLLHAYVSYRFENEQTPLYSSLLQVLQLLLIDTMSRFVAASTAAVPGVLSVDDESTRRGLFKHLWFFFGLIVKSLALDVVDRKLLGDDTNRLARFPESFGESVRELLWETMKAVRLLLGPDYNSARDALLAVAYFLKDLYSVVDRGLVHDCVLFVCEHLLDGAAADQVVPLTVFKFSFLKIVCDHEHYLQLNVPIPDRFRDNVLVQLWKKHFLVGVIANELFLAWPNPETRLLGVMTLRTMLVQHEYDDRYQHHEAKTRVAILYFPVVLRLVSLYGTLEQFRGMNQRANTAPSEEKRSLLICVLHILKNMSAKVVADWWRVASEDHKKSFFKVLQEALVIFDYDPGRRLQEAQMLRAAQSAAESATMATRDNTGKRKAAAKKASAAASARGRAETDSARAVQAAGLPGGSVGLTTGATVMEMLMSSPSLNATAALTASQASLLSLRDSDVPRDGSATADLTGGVGGAPSLTLDERNLRDAWISREVSLVVLDNLITFMYDHKDDLVKEDSVYSLDVYVTLNMLMSRCQSNDFLVTMLRSLRTILSLYPDMFFRFSSLFFITQCGELTYQVLRMICFEDEAVRSSALAILYIMLRRNFTERGNLGRMRLQVTIGAERVLSVGSAKMCSNFRFALDALKGEAQRSSQAAFVEDVRLLVGRLGEAAVNQSKMIAYRHDPETLADLYFHTSQNYNDSPDLRVTWLINLSELHQTNNCLEEAAMCKIHIAALVCGYLELLQRSDAIPFDRNLFRRAAPNIDADLQKPSLDADEGVCSLRQFTRLGLVDELLSAIELLRKVGLFEICIEVYRLLTMIHKQSKSYNKLTECFADMKGLCNQVVGANESNNRLFSKFYRVRMMGSNFGELDGCEFIYKEPAFVRLGDIQERLTKQYESKFGPGSVETLPNKPVDRATLDPRKLYFQLVDCQEYLAPDELAHRKTPFERIWNLRSFIYESPFAQPGKKIGEVADTWKRKTILTVDRPFPFVTKRLRVVEKKEVELSPLEASIELIESRVRALRVEIDNSQTNTRTLQIVLQGSVLLQVNAGPLEICRVFLGADVATFPPEHIAALREAMKLFVSTSHEALLLNGRVIGPDQVDFQRALESGYEKSRRMIYEYVDPEFLQREAAEAAEQQGAEREPLP